MGLKPGKTEMKKLIPVLDADYESVEDAAMAVLTKAWELYESKAKFFTVGQLYMRDGKRMRPWDPQQERVALGPFTTEGQAIAALGDAASGGISYNKAAAPMDEFRGWVVRYHSGTIQSFHQERKAAIEKERASLAKETTQAERLAASTESETSDGPRCGFLTIDDQAEVVQCIRRKEHPGGCFPQYPKSWGLVYRDGATAIREQYEEN